MATLSSLDAQQLRLPPAEQHAVIARQGKTVFGVEIKVVDEHGATLPRDGRSQGELMVRGQWIVSSYYKSDSSALVDGWFPTGDIATIDADGVMQIRDRVKDLIKTGGEWISSIDLENVAVGHPAVAAAAVIGVRHPKWQERPLLFVVRKPGLGLEREEILEYLSTQVARLCVPDEVIFLESLPLGGTGKVQKAALAREVWRCLWLRHRLWLNTMYWTNRMKFDLGGEIMTKYVAGHAWLGLVLAAPLAAAAAGEPADDAGSTVSADAKAVAAAVKRDAKAVAEGAKEGARQVADAAKEVAHDVATSSKQGAHDVAAASKQGAHEVAAAAKRGAEKTKAAVKPGKADDAESSAAGPVEGEPAH